MNKNSLTWTLIGMSLILFVIVKNIYKLEDRFSKDELTLTKFENEILSIELPNNLIVEKDTTYLENGEIFNTVVGVGGTCEQNEMITHYSLSIATYNKDFTNSDSFQIDSLKNNLEKGLHSKNLQLIKIDETEIDGRKGIKYMTLRGDQYEKAVLFSLENSVIQINISGSDTTGNLFNKLLTSVKLK